MRSYQVFSSRRSMKFAIVVHGHPTPPRVSSALRFTEAALAGGHEIIRVFFYHDGVYAANALAAPPQDEVDIVAGWQRLHVEQDVELVGVLHPACVAASLIRWRQRVGETRNNIMPGF